ncbi:hypothetical protein STEG23_022391, partial [Scotinomys teguina]
VVSVLNLQLFLECLYTSREDPTHQTDLNSKTRHNATKVHPGTPKEKEEAQQTTSGVNRRKPTPRQ